MGIRKRSCYTVECNRCDAVLEDYCGELIGITDTRKDAENLAKEKGWIQTGNNTWVCPRCVQEER